MVNSRNVNMNSMSPVFQVEMKTPVGVLCCLADAMCSLAAWRCEKRISGLGTGIDHQTSSQNTPRDLCFTHR